MLHFNILHFVTSFWCHGDALPYCQTSNWIIKQPAISWFLGNTLRKQLYIALVVVSCCFQKSGWNVISLQSDKEKSSCELNLTGPVIGYFSQREMPTVAEVSSNLIGWCWESLDIWPIRALWSGRRGKADGRYWVGPLSGPCWDSQFQIYSLTKSKF